MVCLSIVQYSSRFGFSEPAAAVGSDGSIVLPALAALLDHQRVATVLCGTGAEAVAELVPVDVGAPDELEPEPDPEPEQAASVAAVASSRHATGS
jgi:hypothetical protein